MKLERSKELSCLRRRMKLVHYFLSPYHVSLKRRRNGGRSIAWARVRYGLGWATADIFPSGTNRACIAVKPQVAWLPPRLQTALSRGRIIFAYMRRAAVNPLDYSKRDILREMFTVCVLWSFYNYETERTGGLGMNEKEMERMRKRAASFEASTHKQCLWQVCVQRLLAQHRHRPWGWMVLYLYKPETFAFCSNLPLMNKRAWKYASKCVLTL